MFKRHLMVASISAAATFTGLGLAAFASDDPKPVSAAVASSEAQDAALSDKVETLLRTDIGLAGSQFRIRAQSAIVTIGGLVPDEHALRRALDLASGVRGVREVRNAMEIDGPK